MACPGIRASAMRRDGHGAESELTAEAARIQEQLAISARGARGADAMI